MYSGLSYNFIVLVVERNGEGCCDLAACNGSCLNDNLKKNRLPCRHIGFIFHSPIDMTTNTCQTAMRDTLI